MPAKSELNPFSEIEQRYGEKVFDFASLLLKIANDEDLSADTKLHLQHYINFDDDVQICQRDWRDLINLGQDSPRFAERKTDLVNTLVSYTAGVQIGANVIFAAFEIDQKIYRPPASSEKLEGKYGSEISGFSSLLLLMAHNQILPDDIAQELQEEGKYFTHLNDFQGEWDYLKRFYSEPDQYQLLLGHRLELANSLLSYVSYERGMADGVIFSALAMNRQSGVIAG